MHRQNLPMRLDASSHLVILQGLPVEGDREEGERDRERERER